MNLKELLEKDFGVELPISGGFGNSIDNAIIIHKSDIKDYVGTEHLVLNCLGQGRGVVWKLLGQELLIHNNKKIDKIKIETKKLTKSEIITQIENYYFDITECFGNEVRQDKLFNEEQTLRQIKERIIELEQLNDFNKKCIGLLKIERLFDDTKLTMEFLDVIFNDKSLPLFKSMMENKRIPIMDVLRIVGKDINKNHT